MLALDPLSWRLSGRPSPPTCPNVETPSARLSPSPHLGPGLLRGDPVPPGHRVQLGRRRTPRQGRGDDARRRRDEWVDAGVFEHLVEEAIGAYDSVIGLDLSEVSIDGSLHKAPGGGEGTGPNPTDRGRPVEVVDRHRRQRRADRLGDRRGEPQRLRPAARPPSTPSATGDCSRDRDAASRPRL